jgi:hypothetical protein
MYTIFVKIKINKSNNKLYEKPYISNLILGHFSLDYFPLDLFPKNSSPWTFWATFSTLDFFPLGYFPLRLFPPWTLSGKTSWGGGVQGESVLIRLHLRIWGKFSS